MPISRGWLAALTTERFHYIESESGTSELYAFAGDPGELHDLAGRFHLRRHAARSPDPAAPPYARFDPMNRFESRASVLLLALWFGLVTGFGELALLGLRRFALHRFLSWGATSFG